MNIKLIDNQIARCEGQIQSLTESLPYADGGAYSQDKQRISELRTELGQWKELRTKAQHGDALLSALDDLRATQYGLRDFTATEVAEIQQHADRLIRSAKAGAV